MMDWQKQYVSHSYDRARATARRRSFTAAAQFNKVYPPPTSWLSICAVPDKRYMAQWTMGFLSRVFEKK